MGLNNSCGTNGYCGIKSHWLPWVLSLELFFCCWIPQVQKIWGCGLRGKTTRISDLCSGLPSRCTLIIKRLYLFTCSTAWCRNTTARGTEQIKSEGISHRIQCVWQPWSPLSLLPFNMPLIKDTPSFQLPCCNWYTNPFPTGPLFQDKLIKMKTLLE